MLNCAHLKRNEELPMMNQATRLDLIERQRRRRAEILGWLVAFPVCTLTLLAILLWPVWGGV